MIGPFVLGAMKHSRGDYTAASAFLSLVMAFGATVAFVMLPFVSDDATLQPVKARAPRWFATTVPTICVSAAGRPLYLSLQSAVCAAHIFLC